MSEIGGVVVTRLFSTACGLWFLVPEGDAEPKDLHCPGDGDARGASLMDGIEGDGDEVWRDDATQNALRPFACSRCQHWFLPPPGIAAVDGGTLYCPWCGRLSTELVLGVGFRRDA